MIIEIPRRLRLLTTDQELPTGFKGDETEADQDQDFPPISVWDDVAKRWPNGGRFPSFIFLDQSA